MIKKSYYFRYRWSYFN